MVTSSFPTLVIRNMHVFANMTLKFDKISAFEWKLLEILFLSFRDLCYLKYIDLNNGEYGQVTNPLSSPHPAEYPLLIRPGSSYGKHGCKGVNVCKGGSDLNLRTNCFFTEAYKYCNARMLGYQHWFVFLLTMGTWKVEWCWEYECLHYIKQALMCNYSTLSYLDCTAHFSLFISSTVFYLWHS